MSIAPRIEAHLSRVGVSYNLVHHPETHTSLASSRTARIPSTQMAKAVVTHDGENYRLCVIPASNKLVTRWLDSRMGRQYRLVNEDELKDLFEDCEKGAVPALGQVYGLPVIWDQTLQNMRDIYFESGDHQNLVHVDQGAFMQLMGLQDKNVISCLTEDYETRTQLIH